MIKTTKKRKVLKSVIICIICILFAAAIAGEGAFLIRGSLRGTALPSGFEDTLAESAFDNTANVRIMSSNLLVHYKSWGGEPAKPRAKKYVEMLKQYKPDVIGVQEMCDSWYCLLQRNLPDGYKLLYPVSSGMLVRMTGLIYNSNTLDLIESGNFKYSQGDNPRLRRVVWGVLKTKKDGKTFAVTSTHFDLLRDGREAELTEVMRTQAKELTDFVQKTSEKYSCPVFSVGDFNTMEDTPQTKPIDIPEIYNTLCKSLTDAKFSCRHKVCGEKQEWCYPSYDHIFIKGDATAETFALLSYDCLSDMSDHYPIFADIEIN